MTDWNREVENEALDAIEHFKDEIVGEIVDRGSGDAPIEISSYSESYVNEHVCDKSVYPKDAIELLETLSDYEEDPGYLNWGEDWREALSQLAAFTFSNAVSHRFTELMEDLNRAIDAAVDNTIFWNPPEPEFPVGVLEWSPSDERKRKAFEKKRERLEAEWPERVKKQVKDAVDAFIARERP